MSKINKMMIIINKHNNKDFHLQICHVRLPKNNKTKKFNKIIRVLFKLITIKISNKIINLNNKKINNLNHMILNQNYDMIFSL